MGIPVVCDDPVTGNNCATCDSVIWPETGTPRQILCTFADIIDCPCGPGVINGGFVLTQSGGNPCRYVFDQGIGGFRTVIVFETWNPAVPGTLVQYTRTQAGQIYRYFNQQSIACATAMVNRWHVGNCCNAPDPNITAGYGGELWLSPITEEIAIELVCGLYLYPSAESSMYDYWDRGDGTYTFRLAHKQKQMNVLVQVDTQELF